MPYGQFTAPQPLSMVFFGGGKGYCLTFVKNIPLLSAIRKLASQTIWYGGSYVAAKFLNIFLKFALTHILLTSSFGEMGKVYAYSTFLAILFSYGMETTYFRFVQNKEDRRDLFNTSFSSILISTLFLSACMIGLAGPIAALWKVDAHPEWIRWFGIILGFDALAAIPFARLRQEQRPVKYAVIKFLNIFIQVVLIFFFLVVCPRIQHHHPNSLLLAGYDPKMDVGYVFIANMIASVLTLLFLFKEWKAFKPHINKRLWRQMMVYSLPLLVVGIGGMINEVIDRILLDHLLPGSEDYKNSIIGIYGVGYNIAMMINIFIQIFKMGAEPFFFNEMDKSNAKETYARIMKFFVIGTCWMFLAIVMFRDLWMWTNVIDVRHHPEYAGGFDVIPQLAFGYVCLGIYYNLSIWYKLTNRTKAGATITIIGAAVTLVLNIWWIPLFSYVGSAWATAICYLTMVIISFVWGQKVYPVPYEWKKLGGYLLLAVIFFLVHHRLTVQGGSLWFSTALAAVMLMVFMAITIVNDKAEFSRLPVVGKFLSRRENS